MAIGAGILVLLFLVVNAILHGGSRTDDAALAKAQMELEKLKADIEQKKNDVERQKAAESVERQNFEKLMREMREKDERMRADQMAMLRSIQDQKQKTEMEDKINAQQRKFEADKREMERTQQQALADEKRRAEDTKRALEAAQAKQQTIIQQAPPVYYPYHYRYYWPWGW